MSLVTITGNAWDVNLIPIPAAAEPEVFLRPIATSTARGLLTDREIAPKTFTVATGAFVFDVESAPGLMYVPILRWLKSPEDPRNRARGETEWDAFFPGNGGPISALDPAIGIRALLFGFGPPPVQLTQAIYLDITGPTIKIYGPKGGNA